MSGIGFWELIILFVIGLIVLGPERLPRVANQLGSWLGQARRMTRVMKRQLEDELNIEKHLEIVPPDRTRHASPGAYRPPPLADTHLPVDDDADSDAVDDGNGDKADAAASDEANAAASDDAQQPKDEKPSS